MRSLRHVLPSLVALAFGCSSAPPQSVPVAAQAADAGVPVDAASEVAEPIEWGACPSRFRDQCATLAMPLDHAHPEGETIDVFVSRRGTGTGTGKRQLWLLQGGPGASAESFFGLHDFLTTIDPELEVYTIEHRGVGDSTRLGCSAERSNSAGGAKIVESEWSACRDEVQKQWGSRLAFFSTTQAAHDLALAVKRTRGPQHKTFVYGGSYGTFWANRFGVLHPTAADGIVLDAPVQPGTSLARYDLQFEPIGRRIFSELCPQAPRCAEHLGADPLSFLDRAVAKLRTGHCSALGVDFDTWKTVFGVFLMDYNLRNWLPALVYRLDRCNAADQTAIATLFGNIFRGGSGVPRTSMVLQVHVLLSELWARTHVDDAEIKAANATATFFQNASAPAYLMQDSWPRYSQDPAAADYVPPSVPVLTLAGSLDPAAPPALVGYGYRDRMTGPHQTFVEIPYGAHTVLTSGSVGPDEPGCPAQLVRAFLADPTAKLPVACAARVQKPSFDAPAALATRYFGTEDIYGK